MTQHEMTHAEICNVRPLTEAELSALAAVGMELACYAIEAGEHMEAQSDDV